jgi:hypothetical protein
MNFIRLPAPRLFAAGNFRPVLLGLFTAAVLVAPVASPVLADSTTYVYDVSDPLHIVFVSSASFTTPGTVFVSMYDSTQHQVNISTQDSVGHVTTYAYDASSNLVQSGSSISTPGTGTGGAYDSVNHQVNVSTTDALGNTTTYAYDGASRAIQSSSDINTNGIATTTAYDSGGNQINVSVPDALGHTTTYTYDATNRLAQSGSNIDTLGRVTTMTYDSDGNRLNMSVPDNLGHTTTYSYDATSRMIQNTETITTPGSATSSFYDSTNRRIGITTYDSGVSTMYIYDAVGRNLISQMPLPGPAVAAVYDPISSTYLITVVPEPSSFCLLGLAAAGFGVFAWRKKR